MVNLKILTSWKSARKQHVMVKWSNGQILQREKPVCKEKKKKRERLKLAYRNFDHLTI